MRHRSSNSPRARAPGALVLPLLLSLLVAACDGGGDDGEPPDPLARIALWKQKSLLRGFDVSYYNYGNGTKEAKDFADLKRTGATVAQIQAVEGTRRYAPPYGTNQDGVDALDAMVSDCNDAGLRYIIAVREGPGRQSVDKEAADTIWTNASEQQLYAQMLRDDVVKRYRDDPLFIGINVMVEPNPFNKEIDDDTITTPAQYSAAMQKAGIDLNALMTRFIAAVREADSSLPVIVQAPGRSDPRWFGLLSKQADPYVIYDVHNYTPLAYTHPQCGSPACGGLSYPGTIDGQSYDKAYLRDTALAEVITFQKAHDVPILMGEFGMEYAQTGGVKYLSDLQEIAVENGWHFCLWNFRSDTQDTSVIEFDYERWDAAYWTEIKTWF